MRVLCVNDTGWCQDRKFLFIKWKETTDGPKYGDVCTVTDSEYEKGKLYYYLAEWGNGDSFEASCFIPISDIDEVELAEERSKPACY